LAKNSPIAPGAGVVELPRFFADRYAPPMDKDLAGQVRASLAALNKTGFWPAPLPQTSHPYKGPGSKEIPAGDFGTTHVGDDTDTSPYTDTAKTTAISTQEYLRNMNILIQWRAQEKH
jgi:hypothetical protein